MHLPDGTGNMLHAAHGWPNEQAVDDMDFGVLAPDRRAEVLGNGLGAVLDAGGVQDELENDPDGIGKAGRGIV